MVVPLEYPPTPAFAKAGAAPGTTGGVELGSRVASTSRQHLCQLHAPAIYMLLPFAGPQTLQTLCRPPRQQLLQLHRLPGLKPSKLPAGLQGNNSYSYMPLPSAFQGVQACLTATCPCHLFFRRFKTAVCPASNPPNACKPFRRTPRQQLLQLYMPLPSVFQGFQPSRSNNSYSYIHAPAICFSGGSRLPLARPQTPQTLPTLPQASKATTLTATCPCHLFFRRFKTAVCPPSNPPNASNPPAGLQGNNSFSYTCPCHLFFRWFNTAACPPSNPQTLPTLPQASKATTLTATCPCHLFFRGFKTAVCPPSNPPNASNPPAGLQGNNSYSYSYMPLPSVFFRKFKTPVCPPSNPPNASNPPAGLQGNNSYSYMPLPSVFQRVQHCRLPALKPPKRFQPSRRPPRQQLLQLHAPAICFSGGSRLPFAHPQTTQTLPTLPQASKATTLTATCPCHLFFRGFKTAVCPPSNPPNASNPPASLQGNNSYSYMPLPSVFQEFKTPVCPPSNPPNASNPPAGLQGNNSYSYTCPCHLFFRGFKTPVCPASNPPNASKRFRRPPRQQLLQLYMPLPSVFQEVQDCRLPGLKPPKRFQPSRKPPRQQLLQLHRLPGLKPSKPPAGLQGNNSYSYMPLPSAFQGVQACLTATCPCHLFFRRFKTAVCPASNPPNACKPFRRTLRQQLLQLYMPLPSVFQGVQDCRLPALKPPKRFQPSRRPPRQQLLQLHAPAICFSGGSRLPFARPQTTQTLPTLPQASKATTLTATCPCHLFFRGFKTAVCPPSNPPNASNPPAGLQGNNSYSYMPLPSVFPGVQNCRLPGLKPSKPFRGLARQQLLQLHAPAICFSGGSRLPFARPQTPQTLPTLPQASKATTLTATCPCHLFFRGFKTAACPASNPPNPSAALQGNNCYSYMPLPSVFQGVHGLQEPVIHRLLWGFCCGTNHFVFLHGFPAGVSWLT